MIKRLRIICRPIDRDGAEISTRRREDRTIARHSSGVTLVEIVIALAIVGILSAVSARLYDRYLYRAEVAQAKLDIHDIAFEIARYQMDNDELPDDLATIGKGGLLDPWGNPYVYLSPGKHRPDYDLYSKGKDQLSEDDDITNWE